MSERDMVHIIDEWGRFAGAMTREDFEDACTLGQAIQDLFAPAIKRMEESLGISPE